MSCSPADWRSVFTVALALAIFIGGCDVPTGEPSLNTETNVNVPLVNEKTFVFIGSSKSKFDPLIDTTSSEFDSLFTVGAESKDVSIIQEIDNFDIGSLDQALDEAGGEFSVNEKFQENLIQGSELASQDVDASYALENSVYTSSQSSTTAANLFDTGTDDAIVVPFPSNLLEAPNFGTVDASGATVKSVSLTSDAGSVNAITFTITNNGNNELDDGSGNPPAIQIEDTDGTVQVLITSNFGKKISPGGTASTTVDVSSLTLGDNTQYRLIINSSDTDASNTIELETALSEWRYQATTLTDAQNVTINASRDSVPTVGPEASQFEGIDVGSGSVTLGINNQFSFDLSVDTLELRNTDEPSFGDISDLAIDTSFASPPIAKGTEATETIDMGGRGISDLINVSVSASPANNEITVTADDRLGVSNMGTLDIQTMYFRPDGEIVRSTGTVGFNTSRVTFQSGDFVELGNTVIDVNNLSVGPDVTFDTLALSYPNLRRQNIDGQGPNYQVEDSLEIRFVANPSGPFEFDRDRLVGSSTSFQVSLDTENLRVYPGASNEVAFSVRGRFESSPTAEGIVDASDQVSAGTTIEEFDIDELDVSGADPFTVEVTPDSDGNGELELASDEARTASFEGFGSFADRVDGLELANVNLDFSVTTRNLTSTDAQLYSAILGKNNTESTFLAGTSGDRTVTTPLPFQTTFVNEGSPIDAGSLIRLGLNLESAPLTDSTTRTLTIDESNSTVSDFVNTLPTSVRLIGQAEMNTDGGDLHLQRPLELDAGFTIDIPLQIKNEFVLRDTIDADFSDLKDLTDPEKTLNLSKAELQLRYTNRLPLGIDATLTVADDAGAALQTYQGKDLRLKPAPTNADGAAEGAASGTFAFSLAETREKLRELVDGRELQLRLNMTQAAQETAARFRADDTITFNKILLDAKATIQSGN